MLLPSVCVRVLLRLKWGHSVEELVAQDAQAPDVHAGIVLYALHCGGKSDLS